MKLKISLNRLGFSGSTVSTSIVNPDEGAHIELINRQNNNPHEACRKSAEILREAAARFELLANEANPYSEQTQKRINRGSIPKR